MSNFEHKPGSGTVFRETDPNRPSAYTGSGKTPDGTDVWINLYPATDRQTGELKRDKEGNPFYNVGIKPKQPRGGGGYQGEGQEPNPRRHVNDDPGFADDIPFIRW